MAIPVKLPQQRSVDRQRREPPSVPSYREPPAPPPQAFALVTEQILPQHNMRPPPTLLVSDCRRYCCSIVIVCMVGALPHACLHRFEIALSVKLFTCFLDFSVSNILPVCIPEWFTPTYLQRSSRFCVYTLLKYLFSWHVLIISWHTFCIVRTWYFIDSTYPHEVRAFCPVVQLFWLRASHCTDYHVTSLLFLRVTCPCSLRTYATLKFIRSLSSSSLSFYIVIFQLFCRSIIMNVDWKSVAVIANRGCVINPSDIRFIWSVWEWG